MMGTHRSRRRGRWGRRVGRALGLVGLMTGVIHAERWNQFLGPSRNGVFVTASEVEVDASRTEVAVVWSRPAGAGYTTPLCDGGHVWVHGRVGNREQLMKLGASDGGVVWTTDWAVPFTVAGGGERHGAGPKASPVLIDEVVVTVSIDGTVRGHDAETGRTLWTSVANRRFGQGHPNWGASSSPVIVRLADGTEAVVVRVGDDDAGRLMSIDPRNGRVRWAVEGPGPSYASPNVGEFDGVTMVVDWNHETLVGVDPTDGATMWSVPFPHVGPDQNSPTPMIADGVVYLGAENRGLHAFRPVKGRGDDGDGSGDGWTVEEVWSRGDRSLNMATPLVVRGRLFGLSQADRGRLFCLDAATGETIWESGPRMGQQANLVAVGDEVWVQMSDGRFIAVPVDGEAFEPVLEVDLTDHGVQPWLWSPMTPVRGGVLVKDEAAVRRVGWE